MKPLPIQPKARFALLLAVLAGMVVLNLTAQPVHSPDSSQAVAIVPTSKPYGLQLGRAKWVPSGEDIFLEVQATPEAEIPIQPPEPNTPTEPAPAPEPGAPPLPYAAMARFKNGEKSTLYLRSGNTTIPVAEGDLLGNGEYKIESISETMVSIRYLPMNHLHELSLSGLE
jgi:hypothetical protein